MVSAVFHSPVRVAAEPSVPVVARKTEPPAPRPQQPRFDWRALWLRVLPPVLGLSLLLGIWALLTQKGGSFPTPRATFDAAIKQTLLPSDRHPPAGSSPPPRRLLSIPSRPC